MASLLNQIPDLPGLLPKWMFLVGLISLFNSAQCYATDTLNRRVYPNAHAAGQVSPLSSRTFGTWTALTGVVRLYACSRLHERAWFDLAYATYAVALGHFGLELLVFRSTRFVSGAMPTFFIACGTMVWMSWVRGEYVV